MSTSQAVADADFARFDAAFRAAGAIVTEPDGFAWIDPTKVSPRLLDAYQGLVSYVCANRLRLPGESAGDVTDSRDAA